MKALSCNLYNLSITKRNENIIISGNDLDKDRVSQPYTFESLPDRLILFPKRGFISIDALYWLLNQKRSIIALNYRGELVGDFHPVSGTYKDSETLKKQYNLSNNVKKYLSVSLIETKSNNQLKMIDHLESVNKVDLSGFKEKIYGYKTALNTEQLPANYGTTILKTEAHITKQYWKSTRLCLPKWIEFSARGRGRNVNRKPQFATDHFNCLLNYSYSLLLSEVNRACSLNGFDPNFGFYHKNRTGLKAFSYDVIEPFRVIAEQAVLNSLKGKNRGTCLAT
jgi:CRISPR-associated protein Cas1